MLLIEAGPDYPGAVPDAVRDGWWCRCAGTRPTSTLATTGDWSPMQTGGASDLGAAG
ncbi:hypothetical protein HBB16_03905 [Pseudonocardia sp. MCCB 268]|nr:hypothetical protein [Pseudonocardia cytotoxica]